MLLRKGLLTPVGQVVDYLQNTAASYGVPMGDLRMNYSTRLIQELGLWAQEKGKGPAFQAAGFSAYFVDTINIADPGVLLELATKAGLDPVEAKVVIESRQYARVVDADWAAVRELEIVAAPTFIMGEKRLVGAQPYERLVQFVVENGAEEVIPVLAVKDS